MQCFLKGFSRAVYYIYCMCFGFSYIGSWPFRRRAYKLIGFVRRVLEKSVKFIESRFNGKLHVSKGVEPLLYKGLLCSESIHHLSCSDRPIERSLEVSYIRIHAEVVDFSIENTQ